MSLMSRTAIEPMAGGSSAVLRACNTPLVTLGARSDAVSQPGLALNLKGFYGEEPPTSTVRVYIYCRLVIFFRTRVFVGTFMQVEKASTYILAHRYEHGHRS